MRIDRLTIQNFKAFGLREFDFNPHFNLLVGDNATGKTSVLDALSVALGSWFLGIRGYAKSAGIDQDEVHVIPYPQADRFTFEKQFPSRIAAIGSVAGTEIEWARELRYEGGRTATVDSKRLTNAAMKAAQQVRAGEAVTLPLICTYGTERLWIEVDHRKPAKKESESVQLPSRFEGYRDCIDFVIQESALLDWIRDEVSAGEQRKEQTIAWQVIKRAILSCVYGAVDVYYDRRYKDLVVEIEETGHQLFSNMSDGQRIMLTLVGDLARRATTLNPHLGSEALDMTPGVVTIDELDMHLHPTWQRKVIGDLKRTFPKLQFIATTHSPQLIGEANPDEVLLLEGKGVYHPSQSFGLDSSRVLTEVMQATDRTASVGELTKKIAKLVNDEDFDGAEKLIADLEQIVGENDPEVLRPRGIIRFLETAS